MGHSDYNAASIASLLSCLEPSIFLMLGINLCLVTMATITNVCEHFQECLDVKTALPKTSNKKYSNQCHCYVTLGTTNILLNLDNSEPVWITAIIMAFSQNAWDILTGQDTLNSLGIHLMMPAMVHCIRGAEKIPDHPGKLLDSPTHVLEAVYESFPDTALTHDLLVPAYMEADAATTPIKDPLS
ncbi:hypothetical protein FBU31_000644, partial [Coemansia sp. 'formosensis']